MNSVNEINWRNSLDYVVNYVIIMFKLGSNIFYWSVDCIGSMLYVLCVFKVFNVVYLCVVCGGVVIRWRWKFI